MSIFRNLMVFLTAFYSLQSMAQGERGSGSVGNGGNVISCSWRAPITIDYYEALMSGGTGSSVSKIIDMNQMDELMVSNLFISYLDKNIATYTNGSSYRDVSKRDLKKFRNEMIQILKWFPKLKEWQTKESVSKIDDSFHQYILPEGCEVKQVANNIAGVITVDQKIFSQMSNEQKIALYFHELLYQVGKSHYKHSNSFFTRNLTRYFLRGHFETSDIFDIDFLEAIRVFIHQVTPDYIQTEKQNKNSDQFTYEWDMSLLDLVGKFHLKNGGQRCTLEIQGAVDFYHSITIQLTLKSRDSRMTRIESKSGDSLMGRPINSQFWSSFMADQHQVFEPKQRIFSPIFVDRVGDIEVVGIGQTKNHEFIVVDAHANFCVYERIK